ncbi:MAG: gamma-glutamyl-gamma-aminobutyrate hydrolase family protein [Chloroflexi bacterium]|nr:gamma-glutamyl-gamma-aminobutyrate hydrolase family protein [Chloroflexota bacterium]
MPRPLIGITTHRRDSDEGKKDMFAIMAAYVDSVRNNGGAPVLLPLGQTEPELRDLFERLDGIILSGGGDIDPERLSVPTHETVYGIDQDRDRVEYNLVRWAVKEEKPFLGICRGAQVMNAALGGSLVIDIASHIEGAAKHNYFPGYPRNKIVHPVSIGEETRLAEILGKPIVQVNSLHHQAVASAAPSLEVVASAPDGVIEGIEVPGHRFALGVQWHPEWLQDQPEMRGLFQALVKAAS